MFTRTHAVNSRVYEEAAIAGEACPATTLGITLHNRIVRKNAWTIVSGTSVYRDGLGNVGRRSTSACAPTKDMEEVLEMKNAGRKPSHGATRRENVIERSPTVSSTGEHDNTHHDAPTMASPP